MKHKSEVATKMSLFKMLQESQWRQRLKCLRSEKGPNVSTERLQRCVQGGHHTSAYRAVQCTAERDSRKNELHDQGKSLKHAPLQGHDVRLVGGISGCGGIFHQPLDQHFVFGCHTV